MSDTFRSSGASTEIKSLSCKHSAPNGANSSNGFKILAKRAHILLMTPQKAVLNYWLRSV